jgi:hypothetical protein
MLQFLQVILAVLTVVLLVPQTTKVNFVLRKFYESGMFRTYSEAKWFVNRLTWGVVSLFFLFTYLAARFG